MILKPTVLILGAGASSPYGYPLGGQLVRTILELTAPAGGLENVLSYERTLRAFHSRLRDSGVSSIDDFLESNSNFADLGKICIAAALTVWGPPHGHEPDLKVDWYRYLWGRLHEGAATSTDFRRNRLKIITYNYERSLERYLSHVLAHLYPDLATAGEAAATAFLSEVLPIVHLHGTLGNSEAAVLRERDRNHFIQHVFLADVASGIRIVHEEESKEYETAHAWLREAAIVHILGFGYHPTNLHRLDLATHTQSGTNLQAFGGTALGMEAGERTRANNAINFRGGSLHPVDCLQYLRAHAIFE